MYTSLSNSLKRSLYIFGRAIRETGLALDRVGCTIQGRLTFKEQVSRHKKILNLYDKVPKIGSNTFIAPSSSVIGDVQIGNGSSVWYGSVLRGDVNIIKIGNDTVIGDRTTVHVGRNTLSGEVSRPTLIGDRVIIGEGSIIHACTIEDDAIVEPGCVVLDGSVVSKDSMLKAGSLLKQGVRIPSGQVWSGSPAKYVRDFTESDKKIATEYLTKMKLIAKEHSKYFEELEGNVTVEDVNSTSSSQPVNDKTQ